MASGVYVMQNTVVEMVARGKNLGGGEMKKGKGKGKKIALKTG